MHIVFALYFFRNIIVHWQIGTKGRIVRKTTLVSHGQVIKQNVCGFDEVLRQPQLCYSTGVCRLLPLLPCLGHR